jgi:hypothetical protein
VSVRRSSASCCMPASLRSLVFCGSLRVRTCRWGRQ